MLICTMKKITHFFYLLLSASRFLLFPFSLFWGVIAALRRKCNRKAKTFNIPTICVGNLCTGGSGKTPHVEYIADFLSQNHQVAILSRGYGRKTKGYIHANEIPNLSSEIIGDEPMLYVTKFPNVEVAVCEKRKIGIEKLLIENSKLEIVVLDDAYQHLSVNYSLRILLTEYDRPYFKDYPLPIGNLREFRSVSKYADIIIVTKCPDSLSEDEKKLFKQKLRLKSHQELFFTKIKYEVGGCEEKSPSNFEGVDGNAGRGSLYGKSNILLITGIANPKPLVQYLESQFGKIYKLHFPDHHAFTKKDIEKIIRLKKQLGGDSCIIITTEKDSQRLKDFDNMLDYQTIPIEVVFLEKEDCFQEKLLFAPYAKSPASPNPGTM